jgi:hypothetical protein
MRAERIDFDDLTDSNDLTGTTFSGTVLVLRRSADHFLSGSRMWSCACLRCGNPFEAFEHALVKGYTTSCGCQGQIVRRVKYNDAYSN